MKLWSAMVVAACVTVGFVGCDDDGPVNDAPDLNDDADTFGSGPDDDADESDDAGSDPDDGDDSTPDADDDDSDSDADSDSDSDSDSAGETDGDSRGDDGDTDGDTGEPVDDCDSNSVNLAPAGFVSASSVFDPWFGAPYEPEYSIDGDNSTSWFSNGPESDGTASTFEWYVMQDHCVDRIVIRGNAEHEEEDFREDFGFEDVLVEVFNTSGTAVYSENHDLGGTPDPTIEIDLDGELAHRVVLSFTGHEAPDCGGFSELIVDGRAEG